MFLFCQPFSLGSVIDNKNEWIKYFIVCNVILKSWLFWTLDKITVYLIFCGGAGGGVFRNTTLFAVLPSDHCSVYKFAPFEVWLITFKTFWFPATEREPAGKSNCDVAVVAGVRMISCWYLYQELYLCAY